MKFRLFAAAAAAVLLMTLTSCGGDPYAKCRVVTAQATDAVIYDVGELNEASELIASGRVLKNSGSGSPDGYTAFEVELMSVEKGEAAKGDVITVLQHFEKEKKTITTYTGSRPLAENSQWLFFLKKHGESDGYVIVGDTSGKLPVPNSNDLQRCTAAKVVYSEREKLRSLISGEMTEGNKSSLEAYNAQLSSIYDTTYTAEYFGNYMVTLEQQEVMYNVVMRMMDESDYE